MKSTSTKKKAPAKAEVKENSFPVVAIGASAGGLEAVTDLFQNLSPDTGMAFIYVQHLSPDHKSLLPSILSKSTKMKVQDIEDMEKMEPDNVYIIPYNKEIEVTDGHIKLIPRPKNKTSNLSIDVLFSSLAETHKENVIGIVLSGSASDGTRGLKEIKQAGGITFAQDDSAKFKSMPESAIATGAVDFVLSPKKIAEKLIWMSKHPLLKRKKIKTGPEDDIENNDPHLRIILQLLHKKKNIDFSIYKMNTIKRRMLRRMLIFKIKTFKEYAEFLGQKNNEVELLHNDLLINVTDFFRDTEAFQFLKTTALPRLLKGKAQGGKLRIWVAACATGEEAYSIAMMLLEIQDNKTSNVPFQIFASDLSSEAIRIARIGEYSLSQLKNVSPKRLQRFFIKTKDKYRITKALRDVCVFAYHNILSDPPFSQMDLITCRNLLIYLDAAAQKKAITTFHYSLNDDGCLMLGKSETIGTSAQLFSPLNKKYKIYSRKKNSGTRTSLDVSTRVSFANLPEKRSTTHSIKREKLTDSVTQVDLESEINTILLTRYMPSSVVISHDMEVIEFRGSTEFYLKHSSGKASFNILKMARAEILFELRNAIHHAIKTKKTVCKAGIEIKIDSTLRIINLEVSLLKIELSEPLLLIVFTEQQQLETAEHHIKNGKNNSVAKDRRIKKLEEELAAARSDMGTITHDQEAANEELQSANEEIVSSNEEMQSLNEELETSKEEIESTNEELTTSNQELHARIQQVEELYIYSETILATIHEPMLILDKDIRIKSANKSFCKLFHVIEEEITGISLYKFGNNQWNIPRLRELLEDIVPKNIRFNDFEVEYTFPSIGHKIMLLNAHRIIQKNQNEELVVLAITDVTEVRKKAIELQSKENEILLMQVSAEQNLRKKIEESEKRYNMMLMESPFAFAVLKGKDMVVAMANDSVKQIWGKGKQIEGKPLIEILPEIKDQEFPDLLHKVYTTGIPYIANDSLARIKRKGKMEDVYFNFAYQPYRETDDTISGVTVIAIEVTEQVEAKKIIEESEKQQSFLLKLSDTLKPLDNSVDIEEAVTKIALDFMDADWCHYSTIEEDNLIIKRDASRGDLPSLAGVYPISSFALFKTVLNAGLPFIVDDVHTTDILDEELKKDCIQLQNISFILVPVIKNGKSVGLLSLVQSQPRKWEDSEVKLCVEAANRTWAAVERATIEEGLRRSEERYRTLFTSIDQGFAFCELVRNKEGVGTDFYVLELNDTYEKQSGLSREMVLGKTILQVFPTLSKWWIETYAAVVDNQRPSVFEHYFAITERWFAINAYPGEKDRFAILFSDITERKQADEKIIESESHFRSMADASPMLIWTIDANGLSSYYNKTFLDFIGVSKNEDISDWGKIVHPDDVQSTLDTINTAIAERHSYSLECRVLRADGHWRWVLAQGKPHIDANNEFLGFVGSSFDITERKLFENKLMDASVFAENTAKSKQQFLSNMSHEIRTPLNSILGFTNVLLKTALREEQKEFVQAIKTSGKSLNLLINDILDLAKVDTGKMTFEIQPFEIDKSITSIIHSFDLKIKEKNLKLIKVFDSKIPLMLLGDSLRLNQIFLNLLSNAIKFTHKGEIKLSVKLLSETEENVTLEFTVTDSGIGIADNKLNSIFNVFEQGELSTYNSYGGTGLGLAIVKQLIEAQGGNISIKSKLGVGSIFSFILLFGKTNIRLEEETEIVKSDLEIKNLRVLVVEDVVLNQLLIKIILSDFGFEYEIADNGKIAIEKLQINTYDIVLMDLNMPKMNGFEATEYIRKKMKSQIPIIALTADVTTADVSKCKEFGIDDYISKPINENLLYSKIVELVKKKR